MSRVITGEAVAIDLRVARVGSRMVGAAIDFAVQVTLLFLLVALAALAGTDRALAAALALAAYVLAFVGYPLVLETLWGGRTIGKFAMGLRAVRDDGSPLRFRQALVRALMGAIVEGPTTLGIPAVISSMISARGKRLGDLLAGTVVLQERIPSSGTTAPEMPPPLAGWAATLDLSRLDDALALSARQFLGRAADLSPVAREGLGARLVATVQQRVTPPPPLGTPGWAYLSAVLAERRRRDEQRYGVGWRSAAPPSEQPFPRSGAILPPDRYQPLQPAGRGDDRAGHGRADEAPDPQSVPPEGARRAGAPGGQTAPDAEPSTGVNPFTLPG